MTFRAIAEFLSSPSGRLSVRRLVYLWAFMGAILVAVWQGLTGGDVASGVLTLFTAILAAATGAVTAGRFAERGSEASPSTGDDVEERRRG